MGDTFSPLWFFNCGLQLNNVDREQMQSPGVRGWGQKEGWCLKGLPEACFWKGLSPVSSVGMFWV